MRPFAVDPVRQADSTDSSTPMAYIAVAFVDNNSQMIAANSAFLSIIQCDRLLENSLVEHLATLFPRQQTLIAERFASNDASRIQLYSSHLEPLYLTIAATESSQRVVQFALLSDEAHNLEDHIYTDALTGLGNRRLLDHVISQQSKNTQHMAMLMMDLDRFKQINDTLGHGIGDRLLELVARRTQRATRQQDVIVRIGGDEFIILHESGESTLDNAQQIAGRLVQLMSRPFLIEGHQLNISASVGISLLHQGTDEVKDLFRHADLALYSAKDAGRGNFQLFVKELEQKALKRRELEIKLRRALSLKEFELVYQPQVNMPGGKLTGFEALIRWNSDQLGAVSPDEFIPLAEETGEILSIGNWVLETACLEAARWDEHLSIAINVSTVQLKTDNFVNSVTSALHKSGLAPHRLEIEITESVLINKPDQALKHLLAVRDLGISIAMDDFGTGYSSLSYLNNFPFSKIKIDRAFISENPSLKSRALVDAIIGLGTSMGMTTLAEGVETKEQFDLLARSGCVAAQGYLISRPIPAADVEGFIRTYDKTKLVGGKTP
ncbi:MAG: putative bifunctional diguanylate cyclase/phosphodiesterase [Granulosicoccus sp.]